MMRLRTCGGTLLLLAAAVAVGGLLCEAIVRRVFGPQAKFSRHVVEGPHGLRINQPGARYRHRSADVDVEFRINHAGMRAERDYPLAPPPGTKRVVFLGDSFTVGYEVEIADCFSSVVEKELRARGHAVEAINAGVSGFGTAEEELYLERDLIRYAPSVVVLSFYGNDLVDNVRSNLFVLAEGRLRQSETRYVPMGRIGDFLNTSFVFNWLTERSDAFTIAKEGATRLLKARAVRQNVAAVQAATPDAASASGRVAAQEDTGYLGALAGAILERLYAFCREHGIALVIQSIPTLPPDKSQLVELFPFEQFDTARPGVSFLSGKQLLDPYFGRELLYWTRSTGHWTPFSHRISGRALADLIESRGLLGGETRAAQAPERGAERP